MAYTSNRIAGDFVMVLAVWTHREAKLAQESPCGPVTGRPALNSDVDTAYARRLANNCEIRHESRHACWIDRHPARTGIAVGDNGRKAIRVSPAKRRREGRGSRAADNHVFRAAVGAGDA